MKDLHYGKTTVISRAWRIFVIPLWRFLSLCSRWRSNSRSESLQVIVAEVIVFYLGMFCKWKTAVLTWFSVFYMQYEFLIDRYGGNNKNYLGDSGRFCQIYLVMQTWISKSQSKTKQMNALINPLLLTTKFGCWLGYWNLVRTKALRAFFLSVPLYIAGLFFVCGRFTSGTTVCFWGSTFL